MQSGPLNPERLAPGTPVGPWRVVDRQGRGAYGAVYRVEGVEPEASGRAALKLAQFPQDARFSREAELLSRLRHPCVPRLLGRGHWQSRPGTFHPYFVMEWLDGLPLYVWAWACAPSSRQVLRVLAGLARALEATHAVGGVHRDVKGDNTLVRLEDGQAFLVDFGSATYWGAAPLTTEVFPPGTPPYRSPEAFRFARDHAHVPTRSYAAGPADDLFALGVTGYRLVTGDYPPSQDSRAEEDTGPRLARELNPRCCPELSELISRLLSFNPRARGTARKVAEALERAAQEAGPDADAPLFPGKGMQPAEAEGVPQHVTHGTPRERWRSWLAVSAALAAVWGLISLSARVPLAEQGEDAGTTAVGDTALTAPVAASPGHSAALPIALDMPSKPFPGQIRPDASGRCPRPTMVAINGGCWMKIELELETCRKHAYVYKGKCYEPAAPLRPATSGPVESPDGG